MAWPSPRRPGTLAGMARRAGRHRARVLVRPGRADRLVTATSEPGGISDDRRWRRPRDPGCRPPAEGGPGLVTVGGCAADRQPIVGSGSHASAAGLSWRTTGLAT